MSIVFRPGSDRSSHGARQPVIGAFGGVPDFSALFFTVNNSKFMIGDFINAVLSVIVIAAVVYYFVVAPVGHLMNRFLPESPPPTHA